MRSSGKHRFRHRYNVASPQIWAVNQPTLGWRDTLKVLTRSWSYSPQVLGNGSGRYRFQTLISRHYPKLGDGPCAPRYRLALGFLAPGGPPSQVVYRVVFMPCSQRPRTLASDEFSSASSHLVSTMTLPRFHVHQVMQPAGCSPL